MADERRRQAAEALWRDELEDHKADAYAHTPMTSRMVTERDVRLTNAEARLGSLERFKAQATLLGGIGLLVLGAVATAVSASIFHVKLTP